MCFIFNCSNLEVLEGQSFVNCFCIVDKAMNFVCNLCIYLYVFMCVCFLCKLSVSVCVFVGMKRTRDDLVSSPFKKPFGSSSRGES